MINRHAHVCIKKKSFKEDTLATMIDFCIVIVGWLSLTCVRRQRIFELHEAVPAQGVDV